MIAWMRLLQDETMRQLIPNAGLGSAQRDHSPPWADAHRQHSPPEQNSARPTTFNHNTFQEAERTLTAAPGKAPPTVVLRPPMGDALQLANLREKPQRSRLAHRRTPRGTTAPLSGPKGLLTPEHFTEHWDTDHYDYDQSYRKSRGERNVTLHPPSVIGPKATSTLVDHPALVGTGDATIALPIGVLTRGGGPPLERSRQATTCPTQHPESEE
mmetsp:Transcript_49260/g.111687  ORF Transcript_49260/g.111687 Transcript_49260/m.111687 type:complete len:213 (+) Transcript_49260:345-983(+)